MQGNVVWITTSKEVTCFYNLKVIRIYLRELILSPQHVREKVTRGLVYFSITNDTSQ